MKQLFGSMLNLGAALVVIALVGGPLLALLIWWFKLWILIGLQ